MPSVRLRFLGCGDAFSTGGRFQTSFHLENGHEPLLIDCGASTLIALKRAEIDPASIGLVALSHLHGDHFGGLPWLILDGRYSGRSTPLHVAGPPSTHDRLRQALEALYPGSTDSELPFELRFSGWEEATPVSLGPAEVTPYEVVHPSGAPAFGLRVRYGGKVIAYSGDTEWTDSLLELARDADLFVCECNDLEPTPAGHLDMATVRERIDTLGARRVILTHLGREMLPRAAELECEIAQDGMVVEL